MTITEKESKIALLRSLGQDSYAQSNFINHITQNVPSIKTFDEYEKQVENDFQATEIIREIKRFQIDLLSEQERKRLHEIIKTKNIKDGFFRKLMEAPDGQSLNSIFRNGGGDSDSTSGDSSDGDDGEDGDDNNARGLDDGGGPSPSSKRKRKTRKSGGHNKERRIGRWLFSMSDHPIDGERRQHRRAGRGGGGEESVKDRTRTNWRGVNDLNELRNSQSVMVSEIEKLSHFLQIVSEDPRLHGEIHDVSALGLSGDVQTTGLSGDRIRGMIDERRDKMEKIGHVIDNIEYKNSDSTQRVVRDELRRLRDEDPGTRVIRARDEMETGTSVNARMLERRIDELGLQNEMVREEVREQLSNLVRVMERFNRGDNAHSGRNVRITESLEMQHQAINFCLSKIDGVQRRIDETWGNAELARDRTSDSSEVRKLAREIKRDESGSNERLKRILELQELSNETAHERDLNLREYVVDAVRSELGGAEFLNYIRENSGGELLHRINTAVQDNSTRMSKLESEIMLFQETLLGQHDRMTHRVRELSSGQVSRMGQMSAEIAALVNRSRFLTPERFEALQEMLTASVQQASTAIEAVESGAKDGIPVNQNVLREILDGFDSRLRLATTHIEGALATTVDNSERRMKEERVNLRDLLVSARTAFDEVETEGERREMTEQITALRGAIRNIDTKIDTLVPQGRELAVRVDQLLSVIPDLRRTSRFVSENVQRLEGVHNELLAITGHTGLLATIDANSEARQTSMLERIEMIERGVQNDETRVEVYKNKEQVAEMMERLSEALTTRDNIIRSMIEDRGSSRRQVTESMDEIRTHLEALAERDVNVNENLHLALESSLRLLDRNNGLFLSAVRDQISGGTRAVAELNEQVVQALNDSPISGPQRKALMGHISGVIDSRIDTLANRFGSVETSLQDVSTSVERHGLGLQTLAERLHVEQTNAHEYFRQIRDAVQGIASNAIEPARLETLRTEVLASINEASQRASIQDSPESAIAQLRPMIDYAVNEFRAAAQYGESAESKVRSATNELHDGAREMHSTLAVENLSVPNRDLMIQVSSLAVRLASQDEMSRAGTGGRSFDGGEEFQDVDIHYAINQSKFSREAPSRSIQCLDALAGRLQSLGNPKTANYLVDRLRPQIVELGRLTEHRDTLTVPQQNRFDSLITAFRESNLEEILSDFRAQMLEDVNLGVLPTLEEIDALGGAKMLMLLPTGGSDAEIQARIENRKREAADAIRMRNDQFAEIAEQQVSVERMEEINRRLDVDMLEDSDLNPPGKKALARMKKMEQQADSYERGLRPGKIMKNGRLVDDPKSVHASPETRRVQKDLSKLYHTSLEGMREHRHPYDTLEAMRTQTHKMQEIGGAIGLADLSEKKKEIAAYLNDPNVNAIATDSSLPLRERVTQLLNLRGHPDTYGILDDRFVEGQLITEGVAELSARQYEKQLSTVKIVKAAVSHGSLEGPDRVLSDTSLTDEQRRAYGRAIAAVTETENLRDFLYFIGHSDELAKRRLREVLREYGVNQNIDTWARNFVTQLTMY